MQIDNVQGLFPLVRIDDRFVGYFLDARAEFWKANDTGGVDRYKTAGRKTVELGGLTYTKSVVQQIAKNHADWNIETSKV